MIAADRFVQQGEVALVTCDDDQADWFRSQRHTFDIEVEHACTFPECYITFRVHVIDVLKLVDDDGWLDDEPTLPNITRAPSVDEQWYLRALNDDGDTYARRITLPPDAAPGMWLVRLAVHA